MQCNCSGTPCSCSSRGIITDIPTFDHCCTACGHCSKTRFCEISEFCCAHRAGFVTCCVSGRDRPFSRSFPLVRLLTNDAGRAGGVNLVFGKAGTDLHTLKVSLKISSTVPRVRPQNPAAEAGSSFAVLNGPLWAKRSHIVWQALRQAQSWPSTWTTNQTWKWLGF